MTHPMKNLLESAIINIAEANDALDKLCGFAGCVDKEKAIFSVLVRSRHDLHVINDRLGHYLAHGADTYPPK